MSSSDKYTAETITRVRPWAASLLRTARDRGYRFVPGQFARLGVRDRDQVSIVWREPASRRSCRCCMTSRPGSSTTISSWCRACAPSRSSRTRTSSAASHDRSGIMLCGNPGMVEDSHRILTARGFRLSRRGEPGHLAVEKYW